MSVILLILKIIVVTLVVLVVLIVSILFAWYLGFPRTREKEQSDPSALGLPFEQLRISSVANKQLFAWFLPHERATQTVVVMHGWGANIELMLPLAAPLYQKGLNVLLFDARNHGSSDGHGYSSMVRFAEDLHHALTWLRSHRPHQSERIAIMGHSVGAAASILEVSQRQDVQALVAISSFAHPQELMTRYWQSLHLPNWLIDYLHIYIQWMIKHRFAEVAPVVRIRSVHCPVLLIHGTADEAIPIDDTRVIFQTALAAGRDVTLCEIPDAGHASVEKIETHSDVLSQFLTRAGFRIHAQ